MGIKPISNTANAAPADLGEYAETVAEMKKEAKLSLAVQKEMAKIQSQSKLEQVAVQSVTDITKAAR